VRVVVVVGVGVVVVVVVMGVEIMSCEEIVRKSAARRIVLTKIS
jgi:hypothetical protein